MADDIAEVQEALTLATITIDGETFTAKSTPRFKDGLALLASVRAGGEGGLETLVKQLEEARALLVGMGFPSDAIDRMGQKEVVERALDFTLADLGYKTNAR